MLSSRGVALALASVSLRVLGLTLSIFGLAIIQAQGTNFNLYPTLGIAVAAVGVIVSFLSAMAISEKPATPIENSGTMGN